MEYAKNRYSYIQNYSWFCYCICRAKSNVFIEIIDFYIVSRRFGSMCLLRIDNDIVFEQNERYKHKTFILSRSL